MSLPDTFQLLVTTEGVDPGHLLFLAAGTMHELSEIADALLTRKIINHWFIACNGCHPRDTEQFLKSGNLQIVHNERQAQLLLSALPSPNPISPLH